MIALLFESNSYDDSDMKSDYLRMMFTHGVLVFLLECFDQLVKILLELVSHSLNISIETAKDELLNLLGVDCLIALLLGFNSLSGEQLVKVLFNNDKHRT